MFYGSQPSSSADCWEETLTAYDLWRELVCRGGINGEVTRMDSLSLRTRQQPLMKADNLLYLQDIGGSTTVSRLYDGVMFLKV